jgi:hypothetical protein
MLKMFFFLQNIIQPSRSPSLMKDQTMKHEGGEIISTYSYLGPNTEMGETQSWFGHYTEEKYLPLPHTEPQLQSSSL